MSISHNLLYWSGTYAKKPARPAQTLKVQGVSQLLKQNDWAQIQDFKWYHNDDYIYWKVKR